MFSCVISCEMSGFTWLVLFSKTINRDFNTSHREFRNLAVKDVPAAGLGLGDRKRSHADVLCFHLCTRILLFLEQQPLLVLFFWGDWVFVCISVCASMRDGRLHNKFSCFWTW